MESKQITIIVRNTFLDKDLCTYIFPYSPYKAMFGWYSKFWKKARRDHSDIGSIDKNFIRADFNIKRNKTDRMKIIFPSGFSLDAPFDLNKTDIEILQLHIKALLLAKFGSLTPPKQP